MIEVVAFACRGTLLDWTRAVDAVADQLARRNGESPLDRGAALGRRAEALARGHGLRHGFERLARERNYRVGTDADELLADVVALARPLPGACEAVALATASGRRVLAVSRGEQPEALDRFGGAFDEVVSDPGEIDADPEAILPDEQRPPPPRGGARRRDACGCATRAGPGVRRVFGSRHPLGPVSGLSVQPISTGEAVVASLRARILDGVIVPGARLPEAELAADLGVARPTVREAIQTLCHEGLLCASATAARTYRC